MELFLTILACVGGGAAVWFGSGFLYAWMVSRFPLANKYLNPDSSGPFSESLAATDDLGLMTRWGLTTWCAGICIGTYRLGQVWINVISGGRESSIFGLMSRSAKQRNARLSQIFVCAKCSAQVDPFNQLRCCGADFLEPNPVTGDPQLNKTTVKKVRRNSIKQIESIAEPVA